MIQNDCVTREQNKNAVLLLFFTEKNCKERLVTVMWVFLRIVSVLTVFYFFICSLDLLADSFKLIGGKYKLGKYRLEMERPQISRL